MKFINTNTNSEISDSTLQATISNMIIVIPRDIYGNRIDGLSSLVFDATLFDGVYTITSMNIFSK